MTERILTSAPPSSQRLEFNQRKIQRDLLIRRIGKAALYLNPVVLYFFLWVPIVVLVVFSFNDSGSVSVWRGFTTRWYTNIINNTLTTGTETARTSTELLLGAVGNSLFVGGVSTLISTVIGTMVALSLARGSFPGKKVLDAILYLPVVIPEITQAISLAIFFQVVFGFIQTTSGQRATSGFGTIIIGHVAFSISFVAIVVRARLADMNPRYEEAARDLGANEWRTFWRVTFPLILPGVVAGALLAFTLSLDDFVVSFFNAGIGTTTLPMFVFGLLKIRVPPEINAISSLMLVVSTVLVGVSLLLQERGAE